MTTRIYSDEGKKDFPFYISIVILALFAVGIFFLMSIVSDKPLVYDKQMNLNLSIRHGVTGTDSNMPLLPGTQRTDENSQKNIRETEQEQNNNVNNIQQNNQDNSQDNTQDNSQRNTNIPQTSQNNPPINQPATNTSPINNTQNIIQNNTPQQNNTQINTPQTTPQQNNNEQGTTQTEKLELLIHMEINERREDAGLQPIAFDNELADIARDHSEDMINRNYFSHVSPNGQDFSSRYDEADYDCSIRNGSIIYKGGENLFLGWTYSSINYINGVEVSRDFTPDETLAEIVVDGWMNSQGHRDNLLTAHWRNEGIGVAISPDGKVLVTENFC